MKYFSKPLAKIENINYTKKEDYSSNEKGEPKMKIRNLAKKSNQKPESLGAVHTHTHTHVVL